MKPNYIDIVRVVKSELVAAGVDVDKDEVSRAEITFRVADRIHRRWNPDVGLLFKDTGNQVRERAVDILCWPDGIIVDILGAGREGPNTPLWQENGVPVDPGRWRVPFVYADTEPAPADPIPDLPPISVPPKPELVPPTVPVPPFPPPMPLPPPMSEPMVPAGLHAALSAIGAWLGSQGVALIIAWLNRRKQSGSAAPTGTGTAIPRPPIPTRKPPL